MFRTSRPLFASLSLVACVAALVGCGGGGSGATDTSSASATSTAPTTSSAAASTTTPGTSGGSSAVTTPPSTSGGSSAVTTPPAASSSSSSGSATTPVKINSAPQISGTAASSLNTNQTYSFKPAASDADGDQLSFQIQNKPVWAAFNTVTGQLSGTPATANAGTFANIVISVSDGTATAKMPAFTISVTKATINTATLNWVAPTQNTDNSDVQDLAGFTVVYGTSQTALDQTVRIDNATASSWTMENFPSGTYYFAVKAFTAGGAESALSEVVTKVFN